MYEVHFLPIFGACLCMYVCMYEVYFASKRTLGCKKFHSYIYIHIHRHTHTYIVHWVAKSSILTYIPTYIHSHIHTYIVHWVAKSIIFTPLVGMLMSTCIHTHTHIHTYLSHSVAGQTDQEIQLHILISTILGRCVCSEVAPHVADFTEHARVLALHIGISSSVCGCGWV